MTPLLTAAVVSLTAAAGPPPDTEADAGAPAVTDTRTRELMHTWVTLTLPSALDEAAREAAFAEGFAVFERIEAELNEWEPGSALSRINDGAGGPAVEAPQAACEVIRLALEGAKRTGGLFDPTWAALRDVWRFGSDETGEVPSDDEVKARCALVNWKWVTVRPAKKATPGAACTVQLKKKGMRLGLGGVVKGWGVDQVVSKFRARGLTSFFVQAGGDLYVAGLKGDRRWRVGIRQPRGTMTETFAKLELSDAAFSTSGDYEHFFFKDGVRYHHLIDPRTCRPARASVAVTVRAKRAVDAEFLTKAAFILGPRKGQALAKTFGAEVVHVTPDGQVHVSKGLRDSLTWWPPKGFDAEASRDGGSRR